MQNYVSLFTGEVKTRQELLHFAGTIAGKRQFLTNDFGENVRLALTEVLAEYVMESDLDRRLAGLEEQIERII